MEKTKKHCIGKGYKTRYPNGIHIVSKKPKNFARRVQSNSAFTEYSIGSEGYFVPKKGIKLSKC